jgi:hypothetical protein
LAHGEYFVAPKAKTDNLTDINKFALLTKRVQVPFQKGKEMTERMTGAMQSIFLYLRAVS